MQIARKQNSEDPEASRKSGRWAAGLGDPGLRRVGFALLVFLFVVLTAWSWRKWPDVSIDYGLQLYLPWQLAAGRVFYDELSYLPGGPLSQHFHALLFLCWGPSLLTLVISNLCLLLLLLAVVYDAFFKSADVMTALMIGIVLLTVFSFSQYVMCGNYNYVSPYISETFHGLVMAVLCLSALARSFRNRSRGSLLIAGICFGLVFMTKPETFLALSAAVVLAGLIGRPPRTTVRLRSILALGAVFGIGCLVFPVLFDLWFLSQGMSVGRAARSVAWAWIAVLGTTAWHNPFYQWCTGLDQPGVHMAAIFKHCALYGLGLTSLLGACSWWGATHRWPKRVLAGLGLVGVGLVAWQVRWVLCGYALLPVTGIILLVLLVQWRATRTDAERDARFFPLLWTCFALWLLAKLGLNTRIWHYGFHLAMPAVVANVYFVFWVLPRLLTSIHIHLPLYRAALGTVMAIALGQLLAHSNRFYQTKRFPVGTGGDLILTWHTPETEGIKQALNWIDHQTPAAATLAVFPDGVMINYLSRRPNPTPYTSFTVPEMQAFGEPRMLAAYQAHPPDYIVLIHRSCAEYKLDYFGKDPANGQSIMRWVNQHYQKVWSWGAEPLVTDNFGIKILQRFPTVNHLDSVPDAKRDGPD